MLVVKNIKLKIVEIIGNFMNIIGNSSPNLNIKLKIVEKTN